MQAKDYRADIDTLRAIAVLAVVFYHMHLPFFLADILGLAFFLLFQAILLQELSNVNLKITVSVF